RFSWRYSMLRAAGLAAMPGSAARAVADAVLGLTVRATAGVAAVRPAGGCAAAATGGCMRKAVTATIDDNVRNISASFVRWLEDPGYAGARLRGEVRPCE